MPQGAEVPAPERGRKRRAPSEGALTESLLGMLPMMVTMTDVRGEIQELPLPDSTVLEDWVPPPSVTHVFCLFHCLFIIFFESLFFLIFSLLSFLGVSRSFHGNS